MIISPIKTIIKNLTSQKFTAPVTSRVRIVITPKGEDGDTAIIRGDVFTLIDRAAVAENLISALLRKDISLTYMVDNLGVVEHNTGEPNIDSSATIQAEVAKLNKKLTKAQKPADIVEPTPEVKTPEPRPTKTEEAADTADTSDTANPEVTETAPKAETPQPAEKATRKPRQIKPAN